MPIRAASRRSRPSAAALTACALALAGCGAAPVPSDTREKEAARPTTAAGRDCLAEVWRAQAAPDKAFDRAHDAGDGGRISCATGTSPNEFEAALAGIRAAAASGDRAGILARVGLPLLYIDADGARHELDRAALSGAAYDEAFSPRMLALLGSIRLDDLSLVPGEGAFAELGAVWLAAGRIGGRPRIVTLNLQALNEAAAAVRRRKSPGT